MAPPRPLTESPPSNVRRLLSAVRWRIRWLILLEGIALAIIVAITLFWFSLAIDYLPVKFGFDELSQTARTIILALTLAILLAVLIGVVGRRIFVSLHDRSMALLVEKKYPKFAESLITAVQSYAPQRPNANVGSDATLMQISIEKANRIAGEIDPRTVLNDAHVRRNLYFVAAGVASLIGFALISPTALGTATSRIYLLQNDLWQRESYLRWGSLKVEYDSPVNGIIEFTSPLIPVANLDRTPAKKTAADLDSIDSASIESASANSATTAPVSIDDLPSSKSADFYVGQGSTLNLTLQARSSQPIDDAEIPPRRLPRSCQLKFQSANGNYGSQSLNKVGGPRLGWQMYRLQGAPLTTMTEDLSFSVLGGDYRLGPYKIVVVDQPIVTATQLKCVYPCYMRDENSLRGSDRTIDWVGKMELPLGTAITIDVACNKPLRKVYAVNTDSELEDGQQHALATVTSEGFEFPIPELTQPTTIQFYLIDQDGVVSPSPHTVSISPITDQPPEVESMLAGIGSSITPNAILPLVGTVVDDYDVDRVWLEIETTVSDILTTDVATASDGEFSTTYDFQKVATAEDGFVLPTSGAEITLVIKAADRFDLDESPNVGIGDEYKLAVVSPTQLLKELEQLEVGQRKRLELIFNEVSDIREYLIRTRPQEQRPVIELMPGETADLQPQGDNEHSEKPTDNEGPTQQNRDRELRKLFAQRAILQIDKSAKEIVGVAESFEDIRLQLINNRVDSEDRKIRLAKKIVKPLQSIPVGVMAQLRSVVAKLDTVLSPLDPTDANVSNETDKSFDSSDSHPADLTESAIQLTDQTLIQLDDVLAILVKYETQNELLDIVRRMISEQENLLDQTKKLRQREAFDDLFE